MMTVVIWYCEASKRNTYFKLIFSVGNCRELSVIFSLVVIQIALILWNWPFLIILILQKRYEDLEKRRNDLNKIKWEKVLIIAILHCV